VRLVAVVVRLVLVEQGLFQCHQ